MAVRGLLVKREYFILAITHTGLVQVGGPLEDRDEANRKIHKLLKERHEIDGYCPDYYTVLEAFCRADRWSPNPDEWWCEE